MGWQTLQQALDERRDAGLYRHRQTLDRRGQSAQSSSGEKLRVFCSNDYLGLSQHPDLIDAMTQCARELGVGSGASHLVNGHSSEHHQLELELAKFTGRDRALLFSTGYMANLASIAALSDHRDELFQDKLNHASLLDAAKLSGASSRRYLHNNMQQLEQRLQKSTARRKLIVTDAVFSMDGDIAPLKEMSDIAEQYGAKLYADDAHGFGVLGPSGAGCAEHFNLSQQQLPLLMGTLSKAVGCAGAFIAGSEETIETLIQFARPYMYTTALPPSVAAAARAALRIIQHDGARRTRLQTRVQAFRSACQQQGIPLMQSDTAIQPVLIGDSARSLQISESLCERGFLVTAIRPPTVAVNSARLRVTLSSEHSAQDIVDLVQALVESGAGDTL